MYQYLIFYNLENMFGLHYITSSEKCLEYASDILNSIFQTFFTRSYVMYCRIYNIGTVFFSRNSPGNIKFPRTSRHWGISNISSLFCCEYPRELLSMLENSLSQKIVRAFYISRGYSIFGELINYFK